MNCTYHSQNFAVVKCNSCNRALCPACDHRIKGFPFCQDCIVSGIELLRQQQTLSTVKTAHSPKSSPFFATLFSLICPGLGAAYNGQNSKALVHFGIFAGLFQMAILTKTSLFVFGFLGVWLFAAIDAWRTARAIKFGLAPVADDLLTRKFSSDSLAWALALIGLGTLFFAHTFFNVRLPMREMLPVLLIGLGVYLIVNRIRDKRTINVAAESFDKNLPTFNEPVYPANSVAQFRAK